MNVCLMGQLAFPAKCGRIPGGNIGAAGKMLVYVLHLVVQTLRLSPVV